jgi:hypothetical protein
VEVSTIVVATAVAPFLEGDSVITDVISAVVATKLAKRVVLALRMPVQRA